IADRRILVEIRSEQVGMSRTGSAVSTDVEVVSLLGGNQPEVLTLGLGALPYAPGDRPLQLVRCSKSAIAHLDPDGETDRVLHPIPAPARANTALDRSERFPVSMTAFESGGDQLAPDLRKQVHRSSEEVDALSPRDLGVKAVLPGDLAQHDQLL